jgi:aspartate racemase
MSSAKIFGIIGGAGVAATNKFNDLLEEKITNANAFRDFHHPEVISYQATQAPSRSMFLEGRGESFIPGYIDVANKLQKSGATVLCMTCNTAHYAIKEIQSAVNLPFINLIKEVVKIVKKAEYTTVGIMASDGTVQSKIYEKYFQEEHPKTNIIYPNTEMQKELTKGIVNIKNKNRFKELTDPERPNFIFKRVCAHLQESGADVVISGCTDIRVDFSGKDCEVKVVDSLEVLVDLIFNMHKQNLGAE